METADARSCSEFRKSDRIVELHLQKIACAVWPREHANKLHCEELSPRSQERRVEISQTDLLLQEAFAAFNG
jgi:hypothetical protein